MLYLILYGVFVEGKTIRTQQAFEQMFKATQTGVDGRLPMKQEKSRWRLWSFMGRSKHDLKRLNPNDPLAKDINEQLDLLIYAGFIRNTPYQQLKAIPRYLKAIQYRLDKFDNNPQKIQEVSRYSTRFWKDLEKNAKKDTRHSGTRPVPLGN